LRTQILYIELLAADLRYTPHSLAKENNMKKSKPARLTPQDSTRSGHENRQHSEPRDVGEADLALSRGGTVATPGNGGANGTDHWI
jgi:hypothetical protein